MRTLWIWILLAMTVAAPAFGADMADIKDKIYDETGTDVLGFIEVRQGWRVTDDPHEKNTSISEGRFQLAAEKDAILRLAQNDIAEPDAPGAATR